MHGRAAQQAAGALIVLWAARVGLGKIEQPGDFVAESPSIPSRCRWGKKAAGLRAGSLIDRAS
jgi:hypothetical protein